MAIVIIDRSICEGNAMCFEVCPDDVFTRNGEAIMVGKQEACTYCWLCVEVCPSGAVTVE